MALLEGGKLRSAEGGYMLFYCPGCKSGHMVGVSNDRGPRWLYNGKPEAPTFTTSVLVSSGDQTIDGEYFPRVTHCHSFVTDGRIQFLGDCQHELAGQTVDLPLWPTTYEGPDS